nr:DUF2235 domain-containing protein [Corallococcus exiguus]
MADERAEGTQSSSKSTSNSIHQGNSASPKRDTKVSFFFDGTGNNLDADLRTEEHSNVARLFRAHHETSPATGIFSYYIPGIGTRFVEVGEQEGGVRGVAVGKGGEARLRWAMQKLESVLNPSKGRQIHVALFGFSRGAALARAFARRIAAKCIQTKGGTWTLAHKKSTFTIHLYFMGLFDTVAAVGTSPSENNFIPRKLAELPPTAGLLPILITKFFDDSSLSKNAFSPKGVAGADPSPGILDGHMSWANDLRIPSMVESCVHMVAAHEVRNSFPLDSVRQGNAYPKNCRELVYPGVHSDVGGGYRMGEEARGTTPGSLLSLIPLRAMRDEAVQAGVPLLSMRATTPKNRDFGEDSLSKSTFGTLCRRFDHYMSIAGRGGKSVGAMFLAHMKLYYQWRLQRALRNQKILRSGKQTIDQNKLKPFKNKWSSEHKLLTEKTNELESRYTTLELRAANFKRQYLPYEQDMALARKLKDQYFREKAVLDTMPSSDDSFEKNANVYDTQLLTDVRQIQKLIRSKGRANLRPHYRALLDAYESECTGNGLKDVDIIAFFNNHVHDSLSGFSKDATRPSDPRVIYISSDNKLDYANNRKPISKSMPEMPSESMMT